MKPHHDGHSSYEFGNKPELREILRLNFVDISDRVFLGRFEFAGKAERRTVQTFAYDFVKPYERAAADKQDIRGVYPYKILLRVLSAALRGNGRHGGLYYFEKRLLNALAADVARDGNVFAFSGDFIYFVDINYAFLRLFHVVIGVLNKF